MRSVFDQLKEDIFWAEVKARLVDRPPMQIEKALIEDLDYQPGERAALAFFWGGLDTYRRGIDLEKKGQIKQTGEWLNRFKKAAKALDRLGDKEKTTAHNVALFQHAWEEVESKSNIFLGMFPPPFQLEDINNFWLAGYYLWSASACLKRAREYYPRGEWSVGVHSTSDLLKTPAKGIDYDRLLFRSTAITFTSHIQERDHLPKTAEGWALAHNDYQELFAFPDLKQDSLDQANNLFWPEKAFQLTLNNGWRLIVEGAIKHPHEEDHFCGLVQVHTPSGMFLEQYVLDYNFELREDLIDSTFWGNSWSCQRSLGDSQDEIKSSIRKRIVEEVAIATMNPTRQESLPDLAVQVPVKQTKNSGSKFRFPKGNLLFGDLE